MEQVHFILFYHEFKLQILTKINITDYITNIFYLSFLS